MMKRLIPMMIFGALTCGCDDDPLSSPDLFDAEPAPDGGALDARPAQDEGAPMPEDAPSAFDAASDVEPPGDARLDASPEDAERDDVIWLPDPVDATPDAEEVGAVDVEVEDASVDFAARDSEPRADTSVLIRDASAPEDVEVDAAPPDAVVDAEIVDALPIDAELIDALPIDAEIVDALPIDAEIVDALPIDAELIDALPVDMALPDALAPDAPLDPCDGVDACTAGDGCCPAGCGGEQDLDCLDCRDADAWPAAWATREEEVLAEINARRAAGETCRGVDLDPVAPVIVDARLREASRCHALEMAIHDYTSHTSLDGRQFTDRAREAGFDGALENENIAFGQSTPLETIESWVSSAHGHCEALMNSRTRFMGIGYVRDLEGSYTDVFETNNWPYVWVMVGGR